MTYKTRQPFPHAAYVEGQRNFTYFDRSLTSGLTDEIISSPGDFLYIDQASTGVVSVELNMRQGGTLAPILLAAGGSIECDFSSIKLTASAQLGKTVRVIIGNGARIKGGANINASSMSVSVVDGGLARTKNNKAFSGYCAASPTAGNYAHNQLWNPANSGVNAFVVGISIESSAASTYAMRSHDAAILNLYSASAPASKKLGAAASSLQLRVEGPAATIGTSTYLDANYLLASTPLRQKFAEPIMIAPGTGLLVFNATAAANLLTTFEFFEE